MFNVLSEPSSALYLKYASIEGSGKTGQMKNTRYYTGLDKEKFSAYNCKYFLSHYFSHVLGAQKHRLNETVLLSTHNIFFG